METPNEFCYLSAATSPTSIYSVEDSLSFYTAPTSPISEPSNMLFGFETNPTTPTRSYHHDHSKYSFLGEQDFEFETSRRVEGVEKAVNPRKLNRTRGRSSRNCQPLMAFADELFCDGKVVPLDPQAPKLKLPPGFRSVNDKFGRRRKAMAEPKSPRSVLGQPISRQCLWNDDFDPFMVALENVKVDERKDSKMEGKNCRRARSLSPLRARPNECEMGLAQAHRRVDMIRPGKPNGTVSARWASPTKMWGEDEDSPKKKGPKCLLAEPKGVVFARRVRRVKMGQGSFDGPTKSPARKSGGSYMRENKRQKIMRLLFRVSSSGKECSSDEENKRQRHQSWESWKPTFLRRLVFRSVGQIQFDRDKRVVSQFAKMTLNQYRPRLSFCMGYGGK